MISGFADQLPYAYSVALNNTGNDAQVAVRGVLPGEFTLRRPEFIDRTIYIGPQDRAKKNRLEVTVRVHADRNVLAKFEQKGVKTSTTGKALAIPILRESAPTLIIKKGDPMSVPMLMAAIKRGGQVHRLTKVGKGKRVTIETDKEKVWLAHNDKGTFILQRTGPDLRDNRVLYWFRKSVPIDARLNFDATAEKAALASWEKNFDEALALAIATMK